MLVMPATLLDHPVRRGLAWIVENRKDKSGRLLSRRQLSILAGLSPAHVGNIMNGHQGADIDHRTAQAIARAANVRTEWLLTGEGEREPFIEEQRTPQPPPSSHERHRQEESTHYPPEHVEYWFAEALQRLGHVPAGRILVASKKIAAEAPTKLAAELEADRAAWALLIIETVEAMDAEGLPLTPNSMFHFLLAKKHSKLPKRDRGDAERAGEARKALADKGIEPREPGEWRRRRGGRE